MDFDDCKTYNISTDLILQIPRFPTPPKSSFRHYCHLMHIRCYVFGPTYILAWLLLRESWNISFFQNYCLQFRLIRVGRAASDNGPVTKPIRHWKSCESAAEEWIGMLKLEEEIQIKVWTQRKRKRVKKEHTIASVSGERKKAVEKDWTIMSPSRKMKEKGRKSLANRRQRWAVGDLWLSTIRQSSDLSTSTQTRSFNYLIWSQTPHGLLRTRASVVSDRWQHGPRSSE